MQKIAVSLLVLAALSLRVSRADAPPGVDVYDGFESPTLSKLWSTDRFEPGAVEMQTNIVRAGRSAAKITVRSRDKFEAGINGNKDSERAELLEGDRNLVAKQDAAYEYSFSEFIPTNFPIVSTRLVLAQWKQYCPKDAKCQDDSPVMAVRYVSGKLYITHQIGPHQRTLFETKQDVRGKWTDFRFQTRFTTNANGFIKIWLNGKQVVEYSGENAYPEDESTGYPGNGRFYFKIGLYRDVMPEPMTIYIDEYRKRELLEPKN